MSGRKRIFTDKDIKFILENYNKLGYDKLGEVLGHNPHSIRAVYSRERVRAEEPAETSDDYEDVDPEIFVSLMIESIKNHRKHVAASAFLI